MMAMRMRAAAMLARAAWLGGACPGGHSSRPIPFRVPCAAGRPSGPGARVLAQTLAQHLGTSRNEDEP
jgi:hypothetical protein